MCAILGVSFVPGSTLNRRKLASSLLEAGQVRGTDAAGYAWTSPTGDGMYKNNVPGGQLHVGKIPTDASAMILHTRASTHGDPKDMENNHPVVSPRGTIRLVHNGVVYNHEAVRALLGKTGKLLPDVDSAVIPAVIEEWGIDMTSELAGYASAAWFDTETDNAIHLARFKQSTVFYATLWDGSIAFASTASILAKALNKAGVAWFGSYPEPFDSMTEGEYLQLLDGEFILEGEVEWKTGYQYQGRNWSAQTSGGHSTAPVTTAISSNTPKPTPPAKGSEDAPKALVVVNHNDGLDDADADSVREFLSESLTGEDYIAMFGGDPDIEDVEAKVDFEPDWHAPMVFVTGDSKGHFYATTHDGDYNTYPSLTTMLVSLQWNAGITTGENFLAGPEEGAIRWINHFGDIGVVSYEGDEFSWVASEGNLEPFRSLLPAWIGEGARTLRTLIGA